MSSKNRKTKISKLQERIDYLETENRKLLSEIKQCRENFAIQARLLKEKESSHKYGMLSCHNRFEERSLIKRQIYNWMTFGVMFSIMPFGYDVLVNEIIGHSVKLSEILPDYVLIIFSLSGNLLSIVCNSQSRFSFVLRAILSYLVTFSLVLYVNLASKPIMLIESLNHIEALFAVTTITIGCVVLLGIIAIIFTNKRHE